MVKLKYKLIDNSGGTWGDEPNGVHDTVVLRSTDQTLDGGWRISGPAIRAVDPVQARLLRLEEGDILVTKSSGSEHHIGKASLVTREVAQCEAVFSNFNQRLRLSRGEEPRFYWYVLNSHMARYHYLVHATSTSGLGNLNADIVGNLRVPHVDLVTQKRIADFLDRETARIDELVEKKERLIGLLREKQHSVITSHVAPSGSRTGPRLRHFVEVNPPLSGIRGLSDDTPVAFVPMEAIEDGIGGVDLSRTRPLAEVRGGNYTFFQEGDMLLAKVTPCFENGKKALVEKLQHGLGFATSEVHVIRARSSDVDRHYLKYLLSSSPFRAAGISSMSGASGLRRVPVETILDFRLPVRDVVEQRRISRILDQKTAQIAAIILRLGESIVKLRELRSSLVTAAVTGQIDVETWRRRGETERRIEGVKAGATGA